MTVSSADGTTGWLVLMPVEISGPWSPLGETADAMGFEAAAAPADMETAATSWAGLISSYEEPGTQDVVHSAFDTAPGVTDVWADVIAKAADVLHGFATEATSLESRASDLHAETARLRSWPWVSGLFSGLAGELTE
ncbi:hypothetical protein [Nesterenkonia halobia]|uniref:Uncharacterized protein n=1 Tax=Nesterenkonia halobia TaxID=37922 RepID=A0ABP6RB61_9MICC